MCSDKYEPESGGYVTLRDHLNKTIDLKIAAVLARLEEMNRAIGIAKADSDKAIALAREQLAGQVAMASGLMESRMNGFPDQFVRKGDSDIAITEMRAQVSMAVAALNKIDMASMIPRTEYNIQHQQLSEKIGEAQVDIAEKTELARKSIEEKTTSIKDNADLKFSAMEKRIQGAELLKAEITGKIWTLGIVLSILVIGLEFIIKFVLKG